MANCDQSLILPGKLCDFDSTLCPDRRDDAQRFLEYADRKIPLVFKTLGVPLQQGRFQLRFAQRQEAAYLHNGPIELPVDLHPNDLGCIIHEAVHAAQLPGLRMEPILLFIFNGVADYYRIILSNDQQGDYFNDAKRNLPEVFESNDPYDSGSEFIAHLRKRTEDPDFVRALNNVLRTGQLNEVYAFFQQRFGRSYLDLLQEYETKRYEFVKYPPSTVNRYKYFTEL